MDYGRARLADHLAADYVVGTMRAGARRRFETLLPSHPLLRAAVAEWQLRLMPLTQSVEPVEPPAWLWQRIEARLGRAATPPVSTAAAPLRWWQQLSLWRGVSAFATVAAIALGVLLVTPQPAQPPVVVVLAATSGPTEGQGSFVAGVSADGRSVVTRPIVPVTVAADRALELWAVPATGAPKSLGLISERAASVVQRDRVPAGTAALAVTLEPPGGSPSGKPTGPILFVGKLAS